MKDNIFKGLILCCLIAHLFLVTLGAAYIQIADWVPGRNFIVNYGNASGASSSYGFFSPTIGAKSRAVFDIVDKNGDKKQNLSLMSEPGREVELRLHNIYDDFTKKHKDDEKYRKNLAASLAASIFSQHPEAVLVTLHVQEFWPMTMTEYRQGLRAAWSDLYLARFERNTEASE